MGSQYELLCDYRTNRIEGIGVASERDSVLHSWCVQSAWRAPTVVGVSGATPGLDIYIGGTGNDTLIGSAGGNPQNVDVAYFSGQFAEVLSHFRRIFLSSTIGLRKPDAEAYDHVVGAIGVPADRIVFFDDLSENIEGARERGLKAVLVTSPEDVAKALDALGI